MMKIINHYNKFDFFDGKEFQLDCSLNTYYHFGSTSNWETVKSFIQLIDKFSGNKVQLALYGNAYNTQWKYLSNFQPPSRGFDLEDLVTITHVLNLRAIEKPNNAYETGCEILLREGKPYDIIAVLKIHGGRGPEGMSIESLMNVEFDSEFKKKYYNFSVTN